MAVTKRMRYEILRRDNHACRYCGAMAPEVKLTVDHVLPIALGGSDEPTNLVAACKGCNAGKAAVAPDSPIVEAVSDDALRWAAAVRKAADIMDFDRHVWQEYTWMWDDDPAPLPDDWRESVGRFYSLNVTHTMMVDAVETMARKTGVPWHKRFNYFCGICWRHVEQMQTLAADLIATEDAGL